MTTNGLTDELQAFPMVWCENTCKNCEPVTFLPHALVSECHWSPKLSNTCTCGTADIHAISK